MLGLCAIKLKRKSPPYKGRKLWDTYLSLKRNRRPQLSITRPLGSSVRASVGACTPACATSRTSDFHRGGFFPLPFFFLPWIKQEFKLFQSSKRLDCNSLIFQ